MFARWRSSHVGIGDALRARRVWSFISAPGRDAWWCNAKRFARKHIDHVSKLLSHCRSTALSVRGSLLRAPTGEAILGRSCILGRHNRHPDRWTCNLRDHILPLATSTDMKSVHLASLSAPCNRAECTHNSVSRSAVVGPRAEPSTIL